MRFPTNAAGGFAGPVMKIQEGKVNRGAAGRVEVEGLVRCADQPQPRYSQNHTTITPVPPSPKTSVPPEAATEMLMSLSLPTSVANAEASAQSASHDRLELLKSRNWTVTIVLAESGCGLLVIGRSVETVLRHLANRRFVPARATRSRGR